MKNKFLKITVILLLSVLCLNAQEKKKIHVKMIKDVDGETTIVDTVFEGSEQEGIYFFSDKDFDKQELDSIKKTFHIKDKDGISVISLKDGKINSESLKHIWLSVDSDVHLEKGNSKENIIIKISDGAEVMHGKDHFTILDSDSVKIVKEFIIKSEGEDIFLSKGGNKKVYIKTSHEDDDFVWTMDTSDCKIITITDDLKLHKGDEGTVNVFVTSSNDGDIVTTSEVFVNKADSKSKTIELYIDEDESGSEIKIKDLEEKLGIADENVKITKYKTDDGKIVIKAVISDEEGANTDEEELRKLGIEDKAKLKVKSLEIDFDQSDRILKIEFETEEKISTIIKVYNNKGAEVFTEKVKKFAGKYKGEINLSKEGEGAFYLKISQGEKSFTEKVIKK
jgi:hypothetical protein